jgi:signal transduction histidine kinase
LNTIISLPELRNELDNCDQLIQESGKQMLYLIQNILDVYKYENGSMDLTKTEIHLRQLIKLAFREVAVLANESNIRFEILTGTDYVLNADRELLKRVLINLFSNAVKYSMQCTDVFIRIIEIDDAKVKVEVMDHGIGIEADEISYVFDKYARVKNKTANLVGSTGLGLAFCKMAVEAHGGEIGVESVPGVGSTFWFTLSYQSKLQ